MSRLQLGIRQERFVGCSVEYRGYPRGLRREKKRAARWRRGPCLSDWARGCVRTPGSKRLYSGLVITPQAIRGGAVLEAPEATAWMTMAVPPLLKTE